MNRIGATPCGLEHARSAECAELLFEQTVFGNRKMDGCLVLFEMPKEALVQRKNKLQES